MAWSAEDKFNSYTDGDLNGNSGGVSWNGNWVSDANHDVQGTTVAEGAKAVSFVTKAVSGTSTRAITGISAGIVYVSVRAAQTNQPFFVILRSAGAGKMYIVFQTDGNIKIYNGTTSVYDTIQAYSANTWYRIGIEFDDAAQPDLYRANIDGGAFGAWKGTNGTYATIDEFHIDAIDMTAGTFYVDAISPTYSLAAATATGNFFMFM